MKKQNISEAYIENSLSKLKNSIKLSNKLNNLELLDLNIYKITKRKNTYKKLTFCVILGLIIVISIPTTTFSKSIKRVFENLFADNGLITSENNNNVIPINKSITDNNITVSIKGVIADGVRTVISIEFTSDTINLQPISLDNVVLSDSDNTTYTLSHYGQGKINSSSNLYSTSLEFNQSCLKRTTLKLKINKINGISGDWNIDFDVTPTLVEIYNSNSIYQDNNVNIKIDKVSFSSTYAIVEGKISGSDFDFDATLTNNNNIKVNKIKGEKDSNGNFKLYFPTIEKTNKLVLSAKDIGIENELFSIPINLIN